MPLPDDVQVECLLEYNFDGMLLHSADVHHDENIVAVGTNTGLVLCYGVELDLGGCSKDESFDQLLP